MALRAIYILFEIPLFFDSPCIYFSKERRKCISTTTICAHQICGEHLDILLVCISIFAFTFSKMEKLVKFLILHKFYKYIHQLYNQLTNSRPRKYSGTEYSGKKVFMPQIFSRCSNSFKAVFKIFTFEN